MAHGLLGKCSMEPFLRQDPENSSAQLLTAMLRKYSAHLMGMQQARDIVLTERYETEIFNFYCSLCGKFRNQRSIKATALP